MSIATEIEVSLTTSKIIQDILPTPPLDSILVQNEKLHTAPTMAENLELLHRVTALPAYPAMAKILHYPTKRSPARTPALHETSPL